ncbi:uncharacterized protein LTHEOB_12986 [Lasiodiplodia theobromae]|uniref:uncharacterized protein n=1 Tax=Lasiodiplodia theobromae TaxID=45133 RepID=UPI0015C3F654|nr:uncharacterized protein LTHEOB_12986 [Lasiodiplodia theobromae]KAF4534209.1 hypothetical protein LTHEOB_12986 [Lasiodiplodia theobromae]
MPLCTLHLLALTPTTNGDDPLPTFLSALREATTASNSPPLTIARPLRWIITPTTFSTALTQHTWDLLLILPTASPALPGAPGALDALVAARWSVSFGVPARVLDGFAARNERLLRPREGDVPVLTEGGGVVGEGGVGVGGGGGLLMAKSAQGLELSGELLDWVREFGGGGAGGGGRGSSCAVSMLNLLAFREGRKGEYLKYGKAFAEDVGRKRGGVAKIVGTVVEDGGGLGVGEGVGEKGKRVWDEVALAHYPSIFHFADMLASEDYQAVNRRHRLGSLKDTFILCTTELGLPDGNYDDGGSAGKQKKETKL